MDKNRELAELLDLCWHPGGVWYDGKQYICEKCKQSVDENATNIDFTSSDGKIELLRLMKEMDNWGEFLLDNGAISKHGRHLDCIQIDLITNTTGLLAQAAVEFLRRGKV
jgi:hypothetical protein